jgi:hypothetical protein
MYKEEKMEQEIEYMFEKILMANQIEQKRVGLWLLEGEPKNSMVAIKDEDDVEYQLICYIDKKQVKNTKKLFLHELAHIIIIENIRKKQGITIVKEEIKKYEEQVERVSKEKNEEIRQGHYREIKWEKAADQLADILYEEWGLKSE